MIALRLAFALALFSGASILPSNAESPEFRALSGLFAPLSLAEGRAEFSNGIDTTGNAWSAYATAVFALTGPLHRDGWRLKLSGNYGSYAYETRRTYCPLSAEEKKQLTGVNFSDLCNDIANDPPQGEERDEIAGRLAPFGLELDGDQIRAVIPHQAMRYSLGAAPGYQTTLGALILKTYLGVAYEQHNVVPLDGTRALQGAYWGAQGWIEAWLRLGENAWVSADTSYFTGTSSYSAAVKLGYMPLSWLTLGPELATYGDEDDISGRAGAFLRFEAGGVETTLAGGVSGAYRDDPGAYGSANFYLKF